MHKSKSYTNLEMLNKETSDLLKQSVKNIDSYTHVRGESIYVDDVNVRGNSV